MILGENMSAVVGLPLHLQDTTSAGHGPMSSASSTASSSSSTSSAADLVRCKRRINFTHLQYGLPHAQPVAVARRNARERNRVKQVNNGFSTLRQHIPFTARNKKMSKVETLRCAVEYIRSLQKMLDEQQQQQPQAELPSPVPSPVQEEAPTMDSWASSAEVVLSDATATALPPQPHHQTLHLLQPASLSPPCTEPASSPSPSYISESETTYHHPSTMYEPPVVPAYHKYEPMSPEDEELLDVISWWQQSQ